MLPAGMAAAHPRAALLYPVLAEQGYGLSDGTHEAWRAMG